MFKTRPVNSAILRATHSSFLRKQDLKKKLSSASDHKDVFLDRPALIFIDYTVFYFILQAFYLETTVHLTQNYGKQTTKLNALPDRPNLKI